MNKTTLKVPLRAWHSRNLVWWSCWAARVTNPAPVPSSETQVMKSGNDLSGIICPKKKKKILFFSWIISAGSDSPGSHASACVGTMEEAAQRGEGTNCQRARDHRKCASAHVLMPCHCSLSYKKHFPVHFHLHTLLSRVLSLFLFETSLYTFIVSRRI